MIDDTPEARAGLQHFLSAMHSLSSGLVETFGPKNARASISRLAGGAPIALLEPGETHEGTEASALERAAVRATMRTALDAQSRIGTRRSKKR